MITPRMSAFWRHKGPRALLAGTCVAVLLGLPVVGNAQQTGQIRLTPQDMQATAFAALRDGQSGRALALSEALLLRNEADPVALRVGAQAALNMGETDVARRHGRALFTQAQTNENRFVAARLLALTEAQAGRFTRAQIWLRRARQLAPGPDQARAVAQDYQTLRQRNPWRFSVDLGLRPSSNVNNGSASDTFEFLGLTFVLSPDARQLSGYQMSADGRLSYRLHETANRRTQLHLGAQLLRHGLSDEARAQAPGFDISLRDMDRLDLGVQHDWRIGADGQPVSAALTYGVTRLGGTPYAQDWELGLNTQWHLTDNTRAMTGLRLGTTHYSRDDTRTRSWAVDLGWHYQLDNGHRLNLQSTISDNRSADDPLRDSRSHNLRLAYDFGALTPALALGVAMEHRWTDYAASNIAPQGRADQRLTAQVEIALPQAELYGFAPVATINAYRNRSNVARFETEGLSLGLSFRSNF